MFSGDGCFRLYGGGLADAAHLGLRLFILDNGTCSLVDNGLSVVLPDLEEGRGHISLPRIDFVAAAAAHGWRGLRLDPSLRNLPEIMDACYAPDRRSILVEVPVDGMQDVGANPRLLNLKRQTYL